MDNFDLRPREPSKRVLARKLAATALRLQQGRFRRVVACEFSFGFNLLSLGERFANDASLAVLLAHIRAKRIRDVLIPGCYLAGEDVQFWLRRGVRHLEGIDVYSLDKRWSQIVPRLRGHFGAEVRFRQASIEAIPFEDESFDLVATTGVLEHVRNLDAMVRETARVLRPGGWAWHTFGPLYYTYCGDHCMAAYGESSGYDHLLLDEPEYRKRLGYQEFFDQLEDPNLPFWARQEQFSFAEAPEYLDLFSSSFEILHILVKISTAGIGFRASHPVQWQKLVDAGMSEESLLIKSLALVLRKGSPASSPVF